MIKLACNNDASRLLLAFLLLRFLFFFFFLRHFLFATFLVLKSLTCKHVSNLFVVKVLTLMKKRGENTWLHKMCIYGRALMNEAPIKTENLHGRPKKAARILDD